MAMVKPPEHLFRSRTCSHLLNLSYPESAKALVEASLDQLALSLRSIPDITWQEGSFNSESRMKSREVVSGDSPFGAPLSWLYDKIGTSLSDDKPES